MTEAVVIRPVRVEDVADLEAVRRQPGVVRGVASTRLDDILRSLGHCIVAVVTAPEPKWRRSLAYLAPGIASAARGAPCAAHQGRCVLPVGRGAGLGAQLP
jgi:hypothetical protein